MVRISRIACFVLLTMTACSASDEPSGGVPPYDAGPEVSTIVGKPDGSGSVTDSGGTPVPEASTEASTDAGSAAYPHLLSETGLFKSVKPEVLGTGVRAFQPKYTLWSDGATKRRWLYLPPGETIDTSDMDYWVYPVGTKVWKEFTVDGTRIETRMLHKAGPKKSDWVMIAYEWKDDGTDAVAVPEGVQNAKGTPHDIPQSNPIQNDCAECHANMKDVLLGVTAIQLSHQLPGVTLSQLITESALTNPPAGPFTIPGDAVSEPVLGYLHANCGHCHNPKSAVAVAVSMHLWESTKQLGSVETTTAYTTTVLQPNSFLPNLHIIEPGRPDSSELVYRVSRRGYGQMPPLATEFVDTAEVAKIRAFIESMPHVQDGGVPDAAAPDAGHPVDSGALPSDAATKG